MVLSTNDRHLIRALHEDKKMTISEIVREFPNRHWHKKTVARFIKRLKATGSIERRPGSGLKPTVIPPELVESVLKMIRSKDPDTGTFYSIRKIALLSGASRRMVTKIASTDLGKAPVKKKVTAQTRLKQRVAKAKRLELCSNLLRRFSNKDAVKKIWFSGERCFTLEKPKYVRIESEESKKPTKAAKAKQPAVKAKKQTTKSKKKAADSKNEEDNEEDEEEKVKTDEKDKQVEVEAEKNSSNTETVQHIDVENSNSNIPISSTSVVENRPENKAPISNEIPISNVNNVNITSSNVNVPNIPNVNNSNPSCDLSSTNNDVMNLINIYVSNPLNFVSNPTPSYLPDQNCSYAVPNPANNYCQPPPHGYGVAPNHSGYPGPNSFNYMANCAAQPPHHHHHHHNNNNNNNNPKSSHHYASVSSNMNNKSGGIVGGPTSMKKPSGQPTTQPTTTRISNSVIVSLAVSIGGKSDPIFIDRPSGYLSAECYRREVLSRLLPFIKSKTPDYVFMQDKSTAHQSQNTVKYLQENCPDFIKPEEWPPSCPQLHPIEYFVWKKLQSMVYRGEAIKTVEELKERILKCWGEISQKNIDAALSQWLNKLRAAVKRAKE